MTLFSASIEGDIDTPRGRYDLIVQLNRLLDSLAGALAMTSEEEPVVDSHDITEEWLKKLRTPKRPKKG